MSLDDKPPTILTLLAPDRLYARALTHAPSPSSELAERSKGLGRLTLGQEVDLGQCGVILRQIWVAAEPALSVRLFGGQADIGILAYQYRQLVEQVAEVTFATPPAFCSRSCKNALSDVCVEQCATTRDGAWFDPKPHIDINELPAFPLREFVEDFSPKERTICLGIYAEAMVFQARGRTNERHTYRQRSRRLPPAFTSAVVQDDCSQADPPHPAGPEEGSHSTDGVGEVARS
jgi:hypothetical protein